MDFNQGELDFNHDPSQQGYQKWQQELDTRKKEIESRYGIIIGKPVNLTLTGEDNHSKASSPSPPKPSPKSVLKSSSSSTTANSP